VLCSRPCWVSLQRYPNPLARFKGPTSKNGREEGRQGRATKEGRGPTSKARERESCFLALRGIDAPASLVFNS